MPKHAPYAAIQEAKLLSADLQTVLVDDLGPVARRFAFTERAGETRELRLDLVHSGLSALDVVRVGTVVRINRGTNASAPVADFGDVVVEVVVGVVPFTTRPQPVGPLGTSTGAPGPDHYDAPTGDVTHRPQPAGPPAGPDHYDAPTGDVTHRPQPAGHGHYTAPTATAPAARAHPAYNGDVAYTGSISHYDASTEPLL